jgi:hypothetical protein
VSRCNLSGGLDDTVPGHGASGSVLGRGAIMWKARVGRGAVPSRGAIVKSYPMNLHPKSCIRSTIFLLSYLVRGMVITENRPEGW